MWFNKKQILLLICVILGITVSACKPSKNVETNALKEVLSEEEVNKYIVGNVLITNLGEALYQDYNKLYSAKSKDSYTDALNSIREKMTPACVYGFNNMVTDFNDNTSKNPSISATVDAIQYGKPEWQEEGLKNSWYILIPVTIKTNNTELVYYHQFTIGSEGKIIAYDVW